MGKGTNFAKANLRPNFDTHFALIHYAATVFYNLTGWLEKNKDHPLLCFADYPGQLLNPQQDHDRKKKEGGKPVSPYFKGLLDDLISTLYNTSLLLSTTQHQ